jgi:hypothetical protein
MHRSSIQILYFTIMYWQYLFTIHRDIGSEQHGPNSKVHRAIRTSSTPNYCMIQSKV